jgi:hypothetical protein
MAEEKEGKKIVAIAMEVDGCLTLTPIFEKEKIKVDDAHDSSVNLASQPTPRPGEDCY